MGRFMAVKAYPCAGHIQSKWLVKSNENRWSNAMQTLGQVRCFFASKASVHKSAPLAPVLSLEPDPKSVGDIMTVKAVILDAFGTILYSQAPVQPYRLLFKEGLRQGRRPTPNDARLVMTLNCGLEGAAEH